MNTQEKNKTATIYRMLTDAHICPFGIKSLDLLNRNGYKVIDNHLNSREAAEQFKKEHEVETTPQTFIDGNRIGGYEDLRKFFELPIKNKNKKTYAPVMAVFASAFLMAVATQISSPSTISILNTFQLFIAFSMCILAILKLKDLDSFSNQFITYDLLAMKQVRYAYVYPFLELFAGLGMVAKSTAIVIGITALLIGSIGAVSVIKAVYVDKRELKCACVGGDSNVPLGFISLTENIMMIGMGAWIIAMFILSA